MTLPHLSEGSNKSDTVLIEPKCYNADETRLQQYFYTVTVPALLEQPCDESDISVKLVTKSLQDSKLL